ncbi:archaetidylserine decarboxylase [Teredinibacter turnerae]|uniref:archaetidylserine decarboxylase n=1 Tax=Teredinibacter turnerae TaxID=2426 RepID=UPI000382212B|nr:archaetidylserine decarboxylase [Teredinibacter turnerae]
MKSTLFILLQYITPHHLLSRLVGWFANTEITWIKRLFIEKFAAQFAVNMAEAENPDLSSYASFNEFFCRPLRADARPMTLDANRLLCPADGAISQLGDIDGQTIFQAKGRSFSLKALLGGNPELAEQFHNGSFCTVYLSPKDYHRVHMPVGGTLTSMTHVPGALFSVNPTTVEGVDNLFARNERVVSVFDTPLGPVAVILVGAMIVASIETVWAGEIAPRGKQPTDFNYRPQPPVSLNQGEEMGRFKLGSTVILLLPPGVTEWETLSSGTPVRLGEPLAHLTPNHPTAS